jgi:hypothetical protein
VSNVVLLALKLGFLAVLWLFVLLAVLVIRRDLVGIRTRGTVSPAAPAGRGPRKRDRRAGAAAGAPVLVVTSGSRSGTRIPLGEDPISIGRAADCTLVLGDDFVSSRHARLMHRDGTWLVEDLGSTNGTYLGRERITAVTPVPAGTPIRVGKTVLELRG